MYELEVNDHVNKVIKSIQRSFEQQTDTNCVLRCEGKEIKCHKYMLTAFSSYFKSLNENESMFITNIKYRHLKIILRAIYYGIVNVPVNDLPIVIKKAEKLGLENLFNGLPKDIYKDSKVSIDSDLDEDDDNESDENRIAKKERDQNGDEDNDDEEDDDGERDLNSHEITDDSYVNYVTDDDDDDYNNIRKANGHNYDKKRLTIRKSSLNINTSNSNNNKHHIITSEWTNGKHCNYVIKQNRLHKINFKNQLKLNTNDSNKPLSSSSSLTVGAASSSVSTTHLNNSSTSSNINVIKQSLIVDEKSQMVNTATSENLIIEPNLNDIESSDSEHEVDIKNADLSTIKYLKTTMTIQPNVTVITATSASSTNTTTTTAAENQLNGEESNSRPTKIANTNPSKLILMQNQQLQQQQAENLITPTNGISNVPVIKSTNIHQQQQAFKKQLINSIASRLDNDKDNDSIKNKQASSSSSSSPSSPQQSIDNCTIKKLPIQITNSNLTAIKGAHSLAISYHPIGRSTTNNNNSSIEYIECEDELIEEEEEDEDDEINLAAASGGDDDNWDDFRIDGEENDWRVQLNRHEYTNHSDNGNNESDDGASFDTFKRKRKRTTDPKNFKNRFPCPECGKILANFYYKEEHVRVKHQKLNLACLEPGCNFEVLERDKYNEHLKRIHGKEIKRGRPRSDATF